MSIVIVVGPMACGKTRNAEALRKHFGCKRIVEDYVRGFSPPLKDGDLALTNEAPRRRKVPGVRVVEFADAMKEIKKGGRV